MLVTRETDYAIRALRSLYSGEKKTLAQICQEEVVPQQFGYKILKKLSNAGYVTIKRGKEGGYIIGEGFDKITLFELTAVMENPMDISPCVVPGYRCEVHADTGSCLVNQKLSVLQKMLDDQLKKVIVSTMFEKIDDKADKKAPKKAKK